MELHHRILSLVTAAALALLVLFKWSQIYDRIEIMLGAVNNLAETLEEAVLKNV